jgi:hypothetical protein
VICDIRERPRPRGTMVGLGSFSALTVRFGDTPCGCFRPRLCLNASWDWPAEAVGDPSGVHIVSTDVASASVELADGGKTRPQALSSRIAFIVFGIPSSLITRLRL